MRWPAGNEGNRTYELAMVKMSFSSVVFVTFRSQEMRAMNGDMVAGIAAALSL